MTRSLQTRLIVGTVVAVTATFVAVGLVATRLTNASMQAKFDDALLDKAQELAAQVEQDNGKTTCEIDPKTLASNEVFEVWVEGRVLTKSAALGARDLVVGPDRAFSIIKLGAEDARQISIHGRPRPEPDDHGKEGAEHEQDEEVAAHEPLPEIVVALARTTREVEASSRLITGVLGATGVIGVAVCVGLLLLIIRVSLAPVRAMADTIAAIRVDDLATRIETSTTELVPIARRIDELLSRLASAFARERELTAEIGHELRTPLAGLRATLELALDRERSPERYRVALSQSLSITLEAERMIETLLSLARLDAGHAVLTMAPIDLDQLVRDVIPSIHARVVARSIDLVTELHPVTLETDRDKLRIVLVNLLDNAATYVNEGGSIHVAVTENAIRIANTGCTLDPGRAVHVFERFWRADEARAAGHVGIGLALCKKLIELLDGAIAVDALDGQFVVTINFAERVA